jgi:photosystem II stability/assembly factor-like uncharacterized protein
MKGPIDTLDAGARAPAGNGPPRPPEPKVFLRQQEFRDQRGLTGAPRELALDADTTSPYLRGARQKESLLEEARPDAAITWRSLGPAGIPDGQTYGSGPGSTAVMSGRVTAIAVDPGDSDHLLIGSAAGGVWQTRDGGYNWAPQTDDQPTLSIGAIAFDPSDPSKVYVGTGEGNSEYAALGQGLLVSGDGGTAWTVVARDVFAGIGFYRLVVDDGRLLVATTGGAAVSSDAGTTWSLLHRGLTWDVSAAAGEVLLAAPDGLFAWNGQGAPTAVAVPGLPALDRDRERMGVAHVPSDPGQAFVFAASNGRALLWHRAGAGQPFAPVALPSFAIPPYVDDVLDVAQASYDWHVSVPPGGDDTVYLGAIELLKGTRTRGAWNFSDISSRTGTGDSIHPDQHTMAFDPRRPDVIYAGSDGGIFRSTDAGESWESLNDGLAISEVEYLTQRPDEAAWMLAGLQDNGTVRHEGNHRWSQVALGDGGDCGTNMAHPDVCFHSYYYMAMGRSRKRGDRDSWDDDVSPPDSDALRKLFYPPLEVNEQVVVKAGEMVYISTDTASSWSQVRLPQPASGLPSVASALAIPAEDLVLVGTIRGELFRIERNTGSWGAPTALTSPLNGWISDLVVDGQRYWVTASNPGAVLRSDDEGASWTDVTSNLPAIPVNAIISDPSDGERVWVACDVGVFESRDAGGSWKVLGTGLPNALAEDLLFYEPDRLLRVGTRSRGVWEARIA